MDQVMVLPSSAQLKKSAPMEVRRVWLGEGLPSSMENSLLGAMSSGMWRR